MATQIFVNLPVKDLARSTEFFTRLGYRFDPQFTDEKAACMIVSDDIYVMLLLEKFFQTFTKKPIADATQSTEVLMGLSCESRAKVDEQVRKALAAGLGAVLHGAQCRQGLTLPLYSAPMGSHSSSPTTRRISIPTAKENHHEHCQTHP